MAEILERERKSVGRVGTEEFVKTLGEAHYLMSCF